MRPRNVILSLLLVLALLAFTFMKVRFWEPKRTLTFNHNPSRIEYSQLAICRMDCRNISANDITEIIRNGEINFAESDLKNKPFPRFVVEGRSHKAGHLQVVIIQWGKVARVLNCFFPDTDFNCHCPGEIARGSQKNIKT